MFIKDDGNWINLLNDAVVTYKNNLHSTIKISPVDDSNRPDKVRYTFSFKKNNSKFQIMLGMRINDIFSLKEIHLIGTEIYLKLIKY